MCGNQVTSVDAQNSYN